MLPVNRLGSSVMLAIIVVLGAAAVCFCRAAA